nr:maco-B 64 [Mamestra configurata nucleopolyhedrovirus B]WRQ96952.1 macoB64 [Mamestra configurata nucleopolyhedrovirus B]
MDLLQNITQAVEALIEQNVIPSNTDLDGLANTIYVSPTLERLITLKRIDLKMILLMEFYKERANNTMLDGGLGVIERINRVISELSSLENSAMQLTTKLVDTMCSNMSDVLVEEYECPTTTNYWKHCKQELIGMLGRDEVLQMFIATVYADNKEKQDEDIFEYVANECIMDCADKDDEEFMHNWHIDVYKRLRVHVQEVIECGC